MINTVNLNVFILRFFCVIGGGGWDDELRSGSLFSSYMTLFTRSLCVLINTVNLNVFILRFFCVIGGGGDDELRSGTLFSSYMASGRGKVRVGN